MADYYELVDTYVDDNGDIVDVCSRRSRSHGPWDLRSHAIYEHQETGNQIEKRPGVDG